MADLGTLDPAAYYHVGYLVHDLDTATDELATLLGVSFGEPQFATPTERDRVRYAMSIEGPPFIEVIEASGEGLWSREQGEGLHHFAFAIADMPAALGRLRDLGVDYVETRMIDGATTAVTTLPYGALGVRVELVREDRVLVRIAEWHARTAARSS